ncbi:MAG: hypothetical protein ACRES7_10980 [Gammaproteobacteria bacterium]
MTTVLAGSIGSMGPVTIDGIPDTYHIDVDNLPKIQLGVDAVHINVDSLPKIQLGVDPMTVNMNIAVTEIPNTRVHFPADFSVGLSLFGMELLCVRLCGEAQMINEPYRPNPCEVCTPPLERQPVRAPIDVKANG